jgi:dTDP-glucose 4,6-dehydratase
LTSLITGGTGFLGSHLGDFLFQMGHRVIYLDNLLTGRMSNITHMSRFIQTDIRDKIVIDEPIDYIWHLACPASPLDYMTYPIETLETGSIGTKNVLDLALEKKAKFLLTSTSEVYGDPMISPQVEEYWGNVNPIGPRSVYDEAKRFSEAITIAYNLYRALDTRIVRIFNTYGPKMRVADGRAIPNFMSQALVGNSITVNGDGSQTRSLCYVSDLIVGIYRLMMSGYTRPVNIGNPDEISMLDLAREIIDLTGSKSKIVFTPLPQDDPRVRKPNINLAKQLLHWEPVITRKQGLIKTIEYFKTQLSL